MPLYPTAGRMRTKAWKIPVGAWRFAAAAGAALALGTAAVGEYDDDPADAAANGVLAFEQQIEAAVVRGDVEFLKTVIAPDFSFTHGDGWTSGGAPLRVENREEWLTSVARAPYLFRDLDSVKVEMHGDVALTYGRYRARSKGTQNRGAFEVWFERVYALRGGKWQFLSHRTVRGPTYGK